MFKRIGLFLLVNFLVLLTIVIMTSLLGVGGYITAYGIDYGSLLVFAAIVGFSGSFISLAISRWMAKKMMNVRVLNPNGNLTAQEHRIVQLVHDMSRQSGITKMPEVGIYDSPEVNAFATGATKNSSLVAVSTGLLSRMDDNAVEGVLAHEVAHIANGDMVTMALIQGVVNTFVVFISRIVAYFVSTLVREEYAAIAHFAAIIFFQIFFSILGSIAVMAFSRYREFHADRGGATLAGKEKMIHALQSLKQNVQLVDTDQQALQTMKISGGSKSWTKLFSSHPDLDDRIRSLQSM
ncbi:protease HtpX [Heliorestis acidaminivorans]|uniref:Protease HtpX homolog n=1 Tax=Heliorestis acidaminivorans TaxID=553427 RepID=A0A6I0F2A3_9FIRM|nr:protease HtpX [Heliorestis acidaminivorans]KAB2951179.1 protease HtpX [Heliorestis acidaminivorans]